MNLSFIYLCLSPSHLKILIVQLCALRYMAIIWTLHLSSSELNNKESKR